MTTPFWCLISVAALPYVLAGVGGYMKLRQLGSIDNRQPRLQSTTLQGAGARAVAAQMNAWEALGLFTAAVVVAHLAGADPGASATASIIFVGTRVLHPIFYIGDLPPLRSGIFTVGLGCCVWLFVLAARA